MTPALTETLLLPSVARALPILLLSIGDISYFLSLCQGLTLSLCLKRPPTRQQQVLISEYPAPSLSHLGPARQQGGVIYRSPPSPSLCLKKSSTRQQQVLKSENPIPILRANRVTPKGIKLSRISAVLGPRWKTTGQYIYQPFPCPVHRDAVKLRAPLPPHPHPRG